MSWFKFNNNKNKTVVLVNSKDEKIGLADKNEVHTTKPQLHRAITCFVLDQKGHFLITRRSKKKLLWPLVWETSCSTHPLENETYEESAKRRLKEELGIDMEVKLIDKFEYESKYKDIGAEKEVCALLVGQTQSAVSPNKEEVAEYRFVPLETLEAKIKENPNDYTPWLIIALDRLKKIDKMAWWPSSQAEACKASNVGATPTHASTHYTDLKENDFSLESRKKLKDYLSKIKPVSPEEIFEFMKETAREVDDYTKNFFQKVSDPFVREISIYSPLIRMGGKRGKPKARASIERLAFEMFSKENWIDYVMPVAASEELLATSTYDIDDILDKQNLREGKPTCYAKYGANNAICASFVQRELSEEMIFNTKSNLETQSKIAQLHNKLHRIIYEGQMIDINMTKRTTFEQYLERCYQIAGVFGHLGIQKGAIAGGANESQVKTIGEFGKYYALQGQTRNDFMNLIPQDIIEGRSRTLTRNSFEDIRNGKWTYPVIYTMNNGDSKQKEILIKVLGVQKAKIEDLTKTVKSMIKTGALDVQINLIYELAYRALKSLETLPEGQSKKYLQSLIFLVTNTEDFLDRTKKILNSF